ncbi:MAG: CPBP family intramembrane metalloprotease [Planctomycetaceae bacterium]|jgi:membrane protease YdiL (CAAX protease family)|nr:CPBP family intramembrane metalloprotease [Planctomycetaceae bacterium]
MSRNFRFIVLLFALIFPTLLTYIYFELLSGGSGDIQRFAYGFGKLFQFLIPLIWIFFIDYRHVCGGGGEVGEVVAGGRDVRWRLYYFFEGIGFGVFVFLAIIFLYYFYFGVFGGELAEGSRARKVIVSKIVEFGINDWRLFLLLGIFYSAIHSGLEEYYWRWFLFGRLRDICGAGLSAIISGIGFSAHHIILLNVFFGFDSILCPLGSLAIVVGGIYWAWLYQRSGNLYGAWLGHGIIDAAIFLIGYIIFSA